jgi:prepilin-type processing-associated H-X9-DG protein
MPSGVTNATGPVRNLAQGDHMSWIARILPELDEPARYRQIDFNVGAYHKRNNAVRQSTIGLLICPSYSGVDAPYSCYAGVHHHVEAPIDADNRGALFLNSGIKRDDLVDGSAYTMVVGEKLPRGYQDLGWMSGTPATLRNTGSPINQDRGASIPSWSQSPPWVMRGDEPVDSLGGWSTAESDALEEDFYRAHAQIVAENSTTDPKNSDNAVEASQKGSGNSAGDAPPATENAVVDPDNPYIKVGGHPRASLRVGGFGSEHAGGAQFAFADGSVRYISDGTARGVLQALGCRNDGRVLIDTSY